MNRTTERLLHKRINELQDDYAKLEERIEKLETWQRVAGRLMVIYGVSLEQLVAENTERLDY